MFRKLLLFAALIFGIMVLVGCEYFAKKSYFGDVVIVEYKQSGVRGNKDYLTFRFYEKGTYKIVFSITPDKSEWSQGDIPQNITKNIESTPLEFVVEGDQLPHYLRITITKDGKSESQDFF